MFKKTKQFWGQLQKSLNNISDSFYGSFSLPLNDYRRSQNYLNAYKLSLYANKAIDKRAEKVGQIEFKLMRKDKVVEQHPILDVLYNPNKLQTKYQFWSLWSKYMDIYGSAFLLLDKGELNGEVRSMHTLRPDMVKIEFDKTDGSINKVIHKTKEGEQVINPDNIIFFYRPDPEDPLKGASILASGITSIETEIQISEYQAKVLQNGGRVDGVFNFKQPLTKTQMQEQREAYEEHYGDAKKAGLPMFLGGDISYEKTSLAPEELAYLETKRMTMEDIAILTGVPKTILGAFDGVKFDNADQANRIFLNETIKPILDDLVTVLNEKLVEQDLNLTYVDPSPEDVDLTLKKIENGIKNYWLTPNEARAMHGFDPVKGGDELLIPFNLLPATEEKKTEEKKTVVKKEVAEHPYLDYETRRKYEKVAVRRLESRERKFKKVIDQYFKEQEARLVESISGKKQFKKKDLLAEVFNQTLEVKLARDSVLKIMEELVMEAGADAKDLVGSNFEFYMSAEVGNFIDSKAEVFAKQINDTTREKLGKEFADSFANSESRAELVSRIENVYGDISKGRANTIATTETHAVTQFGIFEGYKQGGLQTKVWISVGDGKVRSSHASVDGEERKINEPFSNGLQYPSDPAGSAGEVINCRCVI